TEMSPIGTLAALKPPFDELTGDSRLDILQTQGYPPFGVQMKITDDAGKELPWDGKTFGRLKVSGPAISKAYFHVDANILDEEGYFDTGDVATIDKHGYMRITDRSKDVIKSGGEWISSIDLENLAVGHPAVAEAAVIGVYHPKWDARQLLIDGPQVFRSLSVGARVQPGIMGAQSRGVFGGGGAGLDHHRPARLPRNATGAGDLLRRSGLRRSFDSGGPRRLRRDLAERIARHE